MDLNNFKPGPDPFKQFETWFDFVSSKGEIEPYAMSLATSVDDQPHVRIVLYKGISDGGVCFFTNYESHKGLEIRENNRVAITFLWKIVNLQVRIEGLVEKVSQKESQAYFATRPRGSQVSAWASHQSQKVKDRDQLVKQWSEVEEKFSNKPIPCPPFWGGYRVIPSNFEFWIGRADRLHDRFLYSKIPNEINNKWSVSRLSP